MPGIIRFTRRGFSQIDAIMVVAIVAFALALVVPAVQSVRESARQTRCAANLKNLAAASLRFEQAHGYVPAGRSKYIPPDEPSKKVRRGFFVWILPYIEGSRLASVYVPDVNWYDIKNAKAIQTQEPVFRCPASPDPLRTSSGTNDNIAWTGACTDFGVMTAVEQEVAKCQGVPSTKNMMRGFTRSNTRLAEVTDGLSNSILLVEHAGLPQIWVCGKLADPATVGTKADELTKQGVWAAPPVAVSARGQTIDGLTNPGPYAVNRSNYKGGVYAFHPGHANVAMGDGSVRSLGEGIDIYAYYALCTIQAGDAAPSQEESAKEDLQKHKPAMPVRGTIVVDGKPAVGAIACFHPRNDLSPRAQRSYGRVGRDGKFTLTTFAKDDGAPQGDYVVTVYWADGDAEPHGGEDASSLRPDLLHGRFAGRESSPLRATVGDKAIEFAPLDLGSSDVTHARTYQLQEK